MAIWDAYQEVSARLKNLRQLRVDKMNALFEIENPLCQKVGETAISTVNDDDTPQDKQFLEAERNIQRLRLMIDERSAEFNRLRSCLLSLLADLEVTITATVDSPVMQFQKSVISEDALTSFVLSEQNMQSLFEWYDDVSRIHGAKTAEVKKLREEILSVGRRLNLSDTELAKKTLTKGLSTRCSAKLIEELTHNFNVLNAEKLRKLPLVIERTKQELQSILDSCWLSELERRDFLGILTSLECTDALLDQLDRAVIKAKGMREQYDHIYRTVDIWVDLIVKQQILDEKASDPNRFKNRGGGLLQEEKERKEVAAALPKREREIYVLTNEYFQQTGKQFLLCGMAAEDFVQLKKEEYEDEKLKKREMHRTQVSASIHSTSKKGGRPPATPSTSRLMTPLQTSAARSNLRSAAKIGASTPNLALSSLTKNTPLAASRTRLAGQPDQDTTLGSRKTRKRNSGTVSFSLLHLSLKIVTHEPNVVSS